MGGDARDSAGRGEPGAGRGADRLGNLTNGFTTQEQFDADREVFEEREGLADGLGPVYNAQSCAECHQTPTTGATSQVTELRAGHFDPVAGFVNPPGQIVAFLNSL